MHLIPELVASFSMDSLPKPLPATGKANDSKPKMNQKINKAAKVATSGPQTNLRANRVFGATRNTNIQGKPVPDHKSIAKTKVSVPKRQPKPIKATQVPISDTKTQATVEKSPENVNPALRKIKSDDNEKNDSEEPKTPVVEPSHVRAKLKVQSTPFYSAVHCSKCRFDRLETASYWIGNIKMAESVGKHSVSSGFFSLALESQAEPIRNLRNELRKYLLRHGYLSEQKEWKEVTARYGLLKVESNTSGINSNSSICRNNENDVQGKILKE